MIEVKKDLFSVTHSAILAHGCNCQGSMGAGVALTVKNRYNKAYREYRDMCMYSEPDKIIGRTFLVEIEPNFYIANMMTQIWYNRGGNQPCASLDAIKSACDDLAQKMYVDKIDLPVWMPKIGAGLGGLSWNSVRETIERSELNSVADIIICVQ